MVLDFNQAERSELQVYPNPFREVIHIQIESVESKSLVITDIQGRIVLEFENVPNEINVSNLVPGIYLVRLGSETRKIIKE